MCSEMIAYFLNSILVYLFVFISQSRSLYCYYTRHIETEYLLTTLYLLQHLRV